MVFGTLQELREHRDECIQIQRFENSTISQLACGLGDRRHQRIRIPWVQTCCKKQVSARLAFGDVLNVTPTEALHRLHDFETARVQRESNERMASNPCHMAVVAHNIAC